jgi:hypothetical protein
VETDICIPTNKSQCVFSKIYERAFINAGFPGCHPSIHVFDCCRVNFIKPGLHLFDHPLNGSTVLINAANAYMLLLAVCAIQFWLGLRFRNFIVPLGIGFALWLTGTIMAVQSKSNLVYYFPYCFHAFPVSIKLKSQLTQVAWTSLGYALLFLVAGFFNFRRRLVSK